MMNSPTLDDLDLLGCSDDLLSLTYNQLGDGHIAVETSVFALGDATISMQSANRSLGFRGLVQHGLAHFRLWTHPLGKVSAGGAILAPRQLLLALPNEMLDVTVLGPSRSLGVTIEFGMLADALTPESIHTLSASRGTQRFIDADERLLAALWRLSRSAFWRGSCASCAEDGAWGERLRGRLFSLMGLLLNETGRAPSPLEQASSSRSIVQDALDFMMAHLTEPLSLQELCRACGRSKRSMIYHFTDALGITPMAYFKLQRLNAVRRALKAANPYATRVLDVAADFGFYHMGHFAVDYRELFGMLPSVTLAVPRPPWNQDQSIERLVTA
jgi:AraC family transcriptional regulator, ethanolamine operon transcriptional activator